MHFRHVHAQHPGTGVWWHPANAGLPYSSASASALAVRGPFHCPSPAVAGHGHDPSVAHGGPVGAYCGSYPDPGPTVAWLPVPAGSSVEFTRTEQAELASWVRQRREPPACFKEAGAAGSEAVVAIWNLNAGYTGKQLWDDLEDAGFEARQVLVCRRNAGAFAVGFHAPYQARAAAVALDQLGESACEVFQSFGLDDDDAPRVQLWVPTADPEASEIPLWMHRLISRKEWRRCETKEELLARHAEWPQEDENKIFF